MSVYIIIPVYNEESKVKEVVLSVQKFYHNIIVVDDGSTDKTQEVLGKIPGVVVLRHCVNRGQGAALRTGTKYALLCLLKLKPSRRKWRRSNRCPS